MIQDNLRFFLNCHLLICTAFFNPATFRLTINKNPPAGWIFVFGHIPNTADYAQMRRVSVCQLCKCYLLTARGLAISLPAEGGGTTQGVTEGECVCI